MHYLTLLPLLCSTTLADYLGPRYPYPTDLSSNTSVVTQRWKNLASGLDSILQGHGNTSSSNIVSLDELKNITFSIGIFSVHDSHAAASELLQFHYTSPEVTESPYGTHKVDADTGYRIASVTKLVTMYAGLLNLNSSDWARPLTDFYPELAAKGPDDYSEHVQWDKVTVWSLAAQLSGVPRDAFGWGPGELLLSVMTGKVDPLDFGLPPLDAEDAALAETCAFAKDPENCLLNFSNYIKSISQRAPTFLPFTSPAYADDGFLLLGQILENITGKAINDIYEDSVFKPLSMNKSSSVAPPESEYPGYAIPKGTLDTFNFDSNISRSSGAVLSSLNDLSKMGISILNNTLLSREETRKWMKPATHTDRFQVSVGAPWEIFRYTHKDTAVITDMYCKSGDSGSYSSFLCLLPDFDAGFTILGTGSTLNRSILIGELGDMVVDALLPALLRQAAVETTKRFAGTYKSSDARLNSSMILSVNATDGAPPGLLITSFISNGTDVLESGFISNRLVPTILDPARRRLAFRTVGARDKPQTHLGGLADLDFFSWIAVGASSYGNLDADLFLIDTDDKGCATAVSPAAWRVVLKRAEVL